jgi:phosphate transport system substrate-binding protein
VVRLRGSNTIGASLAPKLAVAFLTHLGATDAAVNEDQKSQEHVTVTGTVSGQPVTFTIDSPGSKVAFACLGDSSCDIGMASRPIAVEEAAKLSSLGDMASPDCEHVIALDGIAVIVNRANRVNKLTVAQIDALFEGKTTNWSQAGGAPAEVHPFIRDKQSGTYDAFIQLVNGGRDLPTDRAKVLDNAGIADAVAKDEGGVGFVGLAYVKDTKPVAVQDGDAAPLAPTPFAVATEDYAFSRRLYFYTPAAGVSPMASRFVNYALSDDGQKEVARAGFVGLNLSASIPAIPAGAPKTYSNLVKGGRRLSFNFRFRQGTTALDGRGLADLERMARYIKATSSEVHDIALLGFADSQGSESHNVDLSKQRAKSVADMLAKHGLSASITEGFGSALPTAPNDSADGRNKNRRVEVWLK